MSIYNITVSNATVDNPSVIYAIVCRTPISPDDDLRCSLITSKSQLFDIFGDPGVDPSEYSDLLLAKDLVSRNIPILISSINEMYFNNDDFNCPYNGYTEFTFKDKLGNPTIGYNLKSRIKFCQPIIRSYTSGGILNIDVELYLLNIKVPRNFDSLNKLDSSRLYGVFSFKFRESSSDQDIIEALRKSGLELKIINGSTPTSFGDELRKYNVFKVPVDKNVSDRYEFSLHTEDYKYNFTNESTVFNEYFKAIDLLNKQNVTPNFVCLGKLFKAKESFNSKGELVWSQMVDLDPYNYVIIHNYLMDVFKEESDTYLFINTPDVSYSTVNSILRKDTEYDPIYQLSKNYNCDLFFGYVGDYIRSGLYYIRHQKVFYSASLMMLYDVAINKVPYSFNPLSNLNIAKSGVKSVLNSVDAKTLLDLKCNSVVTFETGLPSIYGDYSLSELPNLKYSHISRNFVLIRRLIREYLETRKYILNSDFNAKSCLSYIKSSILTPYKTAGILDDFSASYLNSGKNVDINILLNFNNSYNELSLKFTI